MPKVVNIHVTAVDGEATMQALSLTTIPSAKSSAPQHLPEPFRFSSILNALIFNLRNLV
jgi:hypothetical protein